MTCTTISHSKEIDFNLQDAARVIVESEVIWIMKVSGL